MKFIVIIAVLLITRHTALHALVSRDYWQRELALKCRGMMPWIAFFVAVGLPSLLCMAISICAALYVWPLALLFNILVLLYAWGRGDWRIHVADVLQSLQQRDIEGAWLRLAEARNLLDGDEIIADTGWEKEQSALANEAAGVLTYRYQESVFSVVFYFALFGGAGALFYRLTQLHRIYREADGMSFTHVSKLLHYLEMVPVRLQVLTFALAGNFVSVIPLLRANLLNKQISSVDFLRRAAQASLFLDAVAERQDLPANDRPEQYSDAELDNLIQRSALLGEMLQRSEIIFLVLLSMLALILPRIH